MSLFNNSYNIKSLSSQPKVNFSQYADFSESEKQDFLQLANSVGFESFMLGIDKGVDNRFRTDSYPSTRPWHESYDPESAYFKQIKEEARNLQRANSAGEDFVFNKQVNTQDATTTDPFLKRFGKRINPQEGLLTSVSQPFGSIGRLAYDSESHEFKLGTLGYHDSSLTGNLEGSVFELGTTNQNTIWAKTLANFNTDLFEKSTAFEATEKPAWNLVEKSDSVPFSYYTWSDGKPVTFKDLGMDNRGNPDQPISPDTLLGINDDGSPILAKDRLPMVVDDPGLESLSRSAFEQSFWDYNKDTTNNWLRFARIGHYGEADRTIFGGYGFIDLANVPVVDLIFGMIDPEKTNPDYIAKYRSPKINAKQLIKSIQERDPLLYQDMLEQGIDFERLGKMETAAMFRSYVNQTYQQNAIARAMRAIKSVDGYWWDKYYQGREMIYSTLVSGDAVGQAVITGVTLGTNLAVAGGMTAMRAGAGITTTAGRIAAFRAGLASNVSFGAKTAKTLTAITEWLPVNLPSKLIGLGLKKAPDLSTKIQALSLGKRLIVKSALWTSGQTIEGFVEEGITDVVNQAYELGMGLRSNYDWHQTLLTSAQGALMEPVLGGILAGPTFAVGWSAGKVTQASIYSASRVFGLNPSRMMEFNEYLSALSGNYDELSLLQQQLRQETIVRGLIVEEALGSISTGKFTKAEDAFEAFALMGQDMRSLTGNLTDRSFVDASLALVDTVEKWNTELNNNPTGNLAGQLETLKNNGLIQIETDSSGTLKIRLNEDTTELFLNFIVAGALNDQAGTARRNFISKKIRKELRAEFNKQNPDIDKEITALEEAVNQDPENQDLKTKLQDAVQNRETKLKEFNEADTFVDIRKQIVDRVAKETTDVLSTFIENTPAATEETFSPSTNITLENSQARLEEQLNDVTEVIFSIQKEAEAQQKNVEPPVEEPTPPTTPETTAEIAQQEALAPDTKDESTTVAIPPPTKPEVSADRLALRNGFVTFLLRVESMTPEIAETIANAVSDTSNSDEEFLTAIIALEEAITILPKEEQFNFITQFGCRKA